MRADTSNTATSSIDAAVPQQQPNSEKAQQRHALDEDASGANAEDTTLIDATKNTGNAVTSGSAIPQQLEEMDTDEDEGADMEWRDDTSRCALL